jgi:hypothetical protein
MLLYEGCKTEVLNSKSEWHQPSLWKARGGLVREAKLVREKNSEFYGCVQVDKMFLR